MRILKKKYWPYIIPSKHLDDKIGLWLEENMGKKGGRWYNVQMDFYFKTETDASWFSMKWN